jgi:hypothetical protein
MFFKVAFEVTSRNLKERGTLRNIEIRSFDKLKIMFIIIPFDPPASMQEGSRVKFYLRNFNSD